MIRINLFKGERRKQEEERNSLQESAEKENTEVAQKRVEPKPLIPVKFIGLKSPEKLFHITVSTDEFESTAELYDARLQMVLN